MTTIYGYSAADWDKAKAEMRQILIAAAKATTWISYDDLAAQMHTIHLKPFAEAMVVMLAQISVEENAAGRGLLSAVVVHKENQTPDKGFFQLARQLGRDVTDTDMFWLTELDSVCAYWRMH